MRSLAVALMRLDTVLVLSCGDNPTEPASPGSDALRPVSIRVSPASVALSSFGRNGAFDGTGRDQNVNPMPGATFE